MDGLGDFIASMIEGATGAVEATSQWREPSAGYDSTMPEAGEGGRVAGYEAYERYLAGGPRDLNINDL